MMEYTSDTILQANKPASAEYEASLKNWLVEQLRHHHIAFCESDLWAPLRGDAGFRKYYRVHSQPGLIAVYAPPETENNPQFVNIAKSLKSQGVNTPNVLSVDYECGFMLLEDLGTDRLFDQLTSTSANILYQNALSTLISLQKCQKQSDIFPEYSQALLAAEMELFREWFVPKLLGYELNGQSNQLIDQGFQALLGELSQQPNVLVHRDYHSQNLMVSPEGKLGVVDFQDAVLGPVTYDAVSILRDCYVVWPQEQVESWLHGYYNDAVKHSLLSADVPFSLFKRWFDWMGLQRHIKVLGIFARLWLRDDKQKYLKDLSLVIHYFISVAGQYDEFEGLVSWFESELLPLAKKQSWWHEDFHTFS